MERSIAVVTDVKDLNDLLSGASLDQARCVPTREGAELVVEFTRAMVERQTVVRRGLFRRMKTPWTKCELRLSKITAITVRRLADLPPDQHPLLSCEAVHGGYQLTVQAPDGLQFVLGLLQLDGSFADVGTPIESP
jgi:hypothetical protein